MTLTPCPVWVWSRRKTLVIINAKTCALASLEPLWLRNTVIWFMVSFLLLGWFSTEKWTVHWLSGTQKRRPSQLQSMLYGRSGCELGKKSWMELGLLTVLGGDHPFPQERRVGKSFRILKYRPKRFPLPWQKLYIVVCIYFALTPKVASWNQELVLKKRILGIKGIWRKPNDFFSPICL